MIAAIRVPSSKMWKAQVAASQSVYLLLPTMVTAAGSVALWDGLETVTAMGVAILYLASFVRILFRLGVNRAGGRIIIRNPWRTYSLEVEDIVAFETLRLWRPQRAVLAVRTRERKAPILLVAVRELDAELTIKSLGMSVSLHGGQDTCEG